MPTQDQIFAELQRLNLFKPPPPYPGTNNANGQHQHAMVRSRYYFFITQYMNMSCSYTLKMESVSRNTIFGQKMMVKSGLEKNILKSLHAGR